MCTVAVCLDCVIVDALADRGALVIMITFRDAGVEIAQMSQADFDAWRALAQETSYASFVAEVEGGQELLDMALAVE
jgi:hypothetical protein